MKELRKFGITLGIVLSIWGIILLRASRGTSSYFFGFSAFLIIFGVFFPSFLKGIYGAWMKAVHVINYIITALTLCLIFYLVITPIGIVLKLMGKNLLDTEFPSKKMSCWILKQSRPDDSFENQY